MPYRRIARPNGQIDFAQRVLQEAFDARLFSGPCVDLFALATARGIYELHLRPLMVDGRLLLMRSGFVVQLNDQNRATFSLKGARTPELTKKQRFTFAHEIAHTLTYDVTQAPPSEIPRVVRGIAEHGYLDDPEKNIEAFCQISAGLMLVPGRSLRTELTKLGHEQVDSVRVLLALADRFQVSPEVLVHRLSQSSESAGLRAHGYALMLVGESDSRQQVRALLFSSHMLCEITRPSLYRGVTTWLRRNHLPASIARADSRESEWRIARSTGTLNVKRTRYSGNSWFIEFSLEQ